MYPTGKSREIERQSLACTKQRNETEVTGGNGWVPLSYNIELRALFPDHVTLLAQPL